MTGIRLLRLTGSDVVRFFTILFVMAAGDGYAAVEDQHSSCMSSLLESYGLTPNHSEIYAQRMASKGFDELKLRMYSDHHLLLRINLRNFGVNDYDLARVLACVHSGTGAKSRLCKQTPCGVGGTCTFSEKSQQKYVCDCRPGFTGSTCEKDLCSANPCEHNGTCYITASGFLCGCPEGYTGKLCETVWFNFKKFEELYQKMNVQEAEIKMLRSELRTLKITRNETSQKVASLQAAIEKQPRDVCKASSGVINWKQKAGNYQSDRDNGLLVSMSFKKQRDDTHLRLTWTSSTKQNAAEKCNQWYFTIDGRECSNPAPINGNVYLATLSSADIHRFGTIIGVCRGTSAGNILSGSHQIAMNTRNNCNRQYSGADGYTGWQSTTAVIVEELCPPQ